MPVGRLSKTSLKPPGRISFEVNHALQWFSSPEYDKQGRLNRLRYQHGGKNRASRQQFHTPEQEQKIFEELEV
jgi:hypothetical protein